MVHTPSTIVYFLLKIVLAFSLVPYRYLVPTIAWNQLEYEYESQEKRQSDINNGNLIEGVGHVIDTDIYYGKNNSNKVFVTIPRFEKGTPICLGTVTDRKINNNPIIRPYPNWSWHRDVNNCEGNKIVSVMRVSIDKCDRLWVLDTGKSGDEIICSPKILAFDLKTDTLVYKYVIPSEQYETRSLFGNPIVDARGNNCEDTHIYMGDSRTYAIVVLNMKQRISWRIIDKTMYPDPNYGTFGSYGESFDLMDGIVGMALTPLEGNERKLFYHSMSSNTENWVLTSYIRNRTRFDNNPSSSPEIFNTYKGKRVAQSGGEAMAKNKVMFFGLMYPWYPTVNCWDSKTDYGQQNISPISVYPEVLQMITGVKITTKKDGSQELRTLSTAWSKSNGRNYLISVGNADYLSSLCRRL